jgi:hypothetical protein
VKQTVTAKPKLVQISTAYGKPTEGSPVIPRNKYVEIKQDKPQRKEQRDWPEYKTCKYTAEAIVTEGSEKGELKRICQNPECPVHHPKRQQQRNHADAAFKAEQEKRRREEAIAQTTGMRVLKAIGDAVHRLLVGAAMFARQHDCEWNAAKGPGNHIGIFARIADNCQVYLAGTDAYRKLDGQFRREVNDETAIEGKIHRAEDVHQAHVCIYGFTDKDSMGGSVLCFTGDEIGLVRLRNHRSNPLKILATCRCFRNGVVSVVAALKNARAYVPLDSSYSARHAGLRQTDSDPGPMKVALFCNRKDDTEIVQTRRSMMPHGRIPQQVSGPTKASRLFQMRTGFAHNRLVSHNSAKKATCCQV